MDAFIAGAGTGGTINGAGQFLKGKNPDCHVVLVEVLPLPTAQSNARDAREWML